MPEKEQANYPTPPDMEEYIQKYVNFAEKLIEAEAESEIPADKQSPSEQIHEAFRFWHIDCRDREDLARDLRFLDAERAKERKREKEERFWETGEDDL